MTFEDWKATRERVQCVNIIEDQFGYLPEGAEAAVVYDPGVVAELKDGRYFTHIGRSEYTGTLDELEQRLWDEHAKHEVGGCES